MIAYLKNKLRPFSQFEKQVNQTSLLMDDQVLVLDDLLRLIEIFEGKINLKELKSCGKLLMEEYFQLIQHREYSRTYFQKMKILLQIHLALNEFSIGMAFAQLFLSTKLDWLQNLKNNTKQETLLTADQTVVITLYYHYLQKMASCLQIYHACKIQQFPIDNFGENFINVNTKILWLFKISNLVNCSLASFPQIRQVLSANSQDMFLKEMMLIFWNDIIILYNFLSKELMEFVEIYKSLQKQQALQYYELLLEQIKIKAAVLSVFDARELFDKDKVVKQPKIFNVAKITLLEMEDYILEIKININSPRPKTDRQQSKRQKMLDTGQQSARDDIPVGGFFDQSGSIQKGQLTQRNNNGLGRINESSDNNDIQDLTRFIALKKKEREEMRKLKVQGKTDLRQLRQREKKKD